MFTGIIRELGTVEQVARAKGLVRLSVAAPCTCARVQPLDSVAVSGVCLSVGDVRPPTMSFELIQETQGLTTLGALRAGGQVNVEPSLSLADPIGGHLLLGHVDGLGSVVRRRQLAGELVLDVRVAPPLARFIVPKGAVAVDGVSLTVGGAVRRNTFSIHLIPETLRRTTLRSLAVGDRVNVEVDYLAKLVFHLLHARNGSPR